MIRFLLAAALLLPAPALAQTKTVLGRHTTLRDGTTRTNDDDISTALATKADASNGVLTAPSIVGGTLTGMAMTGAGSVHLGNSGWLLAMIPATENNSDAVFLSRTGGAGALGACRTSDNPNAGSQGCQGLTGIAVNDNAAKVQTAYAGYYEARRIPGAGVTQAFESTIINLGDTVVLTSHSLLNTGLTAADWHGCGRPDVPGSNPCSVGVAFVNNGAPFHTGILFPENSLDLQNGQAPVMDMARGHSLIWRDPSVGSAVLQIRSDVTVPGGGGQLVAANDGIHMQTDAAYDMAVFRTDGRLDFMSDTRLRLLSFATIPSAGIGGRIAYCTDCINSARGDTAGHGTGTAIVDTGSSWIAIPGAPPTH